MSTKLEVCCGSYQDVVSAYKGHADRVELNSALHMGGLTPSLATLIKAKKMCSIPIICMTRVRGAGFCFNDEEKEIMYEDAKLMLEHGADGIAFGYLTDQRTIDVTETKKMVELIHSYHKEAVFHRAFDCVMDMDEAIQVLISLGVDRILTSGLKHTVVEGTMNLAYLQQRYGNQIEILAGCGVNEENVEKLVADTGVHQVHSSCKGWQNDVTTKGEEVSYAYASEPHELDYDVVSLKKVLALKMRISKS